MKDESKKDEIALILTHNQDHTIIVTGTEDGPSGVEVLTPLKEGQSIHGEVVFLEQKDDTFFNVKRTKLGTSSGPRQVATDEYRENYKRIFGKKNLN